MANLQAVECPDIFQYRDFSVFLASGTTITTAAQPLFTVDKDTWLDYAVIRSGPTTDADATFTLFAAASGTAIASGTALSDAATTPLATANTVTAFVGPSAAAISGIRIPAGYTVGVSRTNASTNDATFSMSFRTRTRSIN